MKKDAISMIKAINITIVIILVKNMLLLIWALASLIIGFMSLDLAGFAFFGFNFLDCFLE
jgi:hypothetical protein